MAEEERNIPEWRNHAACTDGENVLLVLDEIRTKVVEAIKNKQHVEAVKTPVRSVYGFLRVGPTCSGLTTKENGAITYLIMLGSKPKSKADMMYDLAALADKEDWKEPFIP